MQGTRFIQVLDTGLPRSIVPVEVQESSLLIGTSSDMAYNANLISAPIDLFRAYGAKAGPGMRKLRLDTTKNTLSGGTSPGIRATLYVYPTFASCNLDTGLAATFAITPVGGLLRIDNATAVASIAEKSAVKWRDLAWDPVEGVAQDDCWYRWARVKLETYGDPTGGVWQAQFYYNYVTNAGVEQYV